MDDVLDFAKFGGPVYVGRDNGIEARKRFKVHRYDTRGSQVTVRIPNETYSVNSSFFLGLFGDSFKRFGTKETFMAHYNFVAPPHVMNTLTSVLDTAFKSRGVLSLRRENE
jgi:hypothetical protein